MKSIQVKASHQTAVILIITAVSITQQSLMRGILAGLAVLLLLLAYENDWFDVLIQKLIGWFALVRVWFATVKDRGVVYVDPFDILFGYNVDTGQPVIHSIETVDTLFVVGLRGMGKTSLIHSLIHWIIKYHSPRDIKLAIFDLKDGLDFSIYGRLPHLTNRIAVTLDDAERLLTSLRNEQDTRAQLYKAIPRDRLCNNLSAYHRIKHELRLDLPDLPLIIAIVDEMHNLSDNARSLSMLAKLIKEGRAYGIKVYGATQQQKADMVPTNITSQFATKAALYLTDVGQYSRLGIVKDVWERLSKRRGRFILNVDGDGVIVQSQFVPEKALEDMARERSMKSGDPAPLPELEKVVTEAAVLYQGTREQKEAIVMRWLMGLDEKPNKTEFANYFDVSEKTYYNIGVPKLWNELQKK